jgi:hypothetical protein
MSGITTDVSLNVLCDQRKKQMLFNIPQFRYTPVSPYNGIYTKFDLDMRRKAEVLKYSNNSSSSKTNNLTKSQKYAQIVKGYTQKQVFQSKKITILDVSGTYNKITVGYPDKLLISNTMQTDPSAVQIVGYQGYFKYTVIKNGQIVNCANDGLIPTPTSSCGVPGPVINLIDNEKVPLYNFINYSINNAAYSDSKNENVTFWELITIPNVYLYTAYPPVPGYIGSLLITPRVDQNSYIYTLNIPIGVYSTDASANRTSKLASIKIKSISFTVKYSNTPIATENYTITLLQKSLNQTIVTNLNKLNTNVSNYGYFSYLDTVIVSNIILPTYPGYVYDFYLSINTDSDITNTNVFSNYSNDIANSILTISA